MLGVGVYGGRKRACRHADCAAECAEQHRLGQELGADVILRRAERAAQADLRAAFKDGDEHDVRNADRADQQGDGAEAEEQPVERALRVGARNQRV